jgi:hypothetical protein
LSLLNSYSVISIISDQLFSAKCHHFTTIEVRFLIFATRQTTIINHDELFQLIYQCLNAATLLPISSEIFFGQIVLSGKYDLKWLWTWATVGNVTGSMINKKYQAI